MKGRDLVVVLIVVALGINISSHLFLGQNAFRAANPVTSPEQSELSVFLKHFFRNNRPPSSSEWGANLTIGMPSRSAHLKCSGCSQKSWRHVSIEFLFCLQAQE